MTDGKVEANLTVRFACSAKLKLRESKRGAHLLAFFVNVSVKASFIGCGHCCSESRRVGRQRRECED